MSKCSTCESDVYGRKKHCEICDKLRALAHNQNFRARSMDIEGIINPDEWVAVCIKYNYQCLRCGTKANISIDHVQSFWQKGVNTIDNVQPLCTRCNSAKTYDVDYRHENLEVRAKRWKYIAERRGRKNGRQGQLTLTYCLSGDYFDTMCLYLINQNIEPTKDSIQRLTREWIYEDMGNRLDKIQPSL